MTETERDLEELKRWLAHLDPEHPAVQVLLQAALRRKRALREGRRGR